MIEEDYVSFETAKLLKEKGFNEPTMHYFNADGTKRKFQQAHYLDDVAQPTPQMVMKYLRVMYNIFISIDIYSKDFEGNIRYCANIYWYGSRMILDTPIICDTFEETCDASIKYVLENLI